MKSFQIKDLMVTIDPQSAKAAVPPAVCHAGCSVLAASLACHAGCSILVSPIACHAGCSILISPLTCHGCTFIISIPCGCSVVHSIPAPTIGTISPQVHAALPDMSHSELEQLRGEISDLHTKVEEHMKQKPEDLDMLESKLKEALQEVAVQKANLKGK